MEIEKVLKPNSLNKNAFAEVIESTLNHYTAQCWKWDDFPDFSSLVEIKDQNHTTLGVVTQVQTGSMDPMRYPFPYQKTEEELLKEQPQIFEFLKTTFKVQILGYLDSRGVLYHVLPPKPCKIHSFVSTSKKDLIQIFFKNTDYLHLLFAFESNLTNLDELLLGILKQLEEYKFLTNEMLREFSKTFSLLTGNDYRRLKLFLKRAQALSPK
ncbi:hypothetical protein KAW80_03365 [Candidatus Babeliales bacterium]|nr:hypothetical protein [Candidatus Babeliales bacterium]